jgi:hypothetical protein
MPHIHWVARQNKLQMLRDKDEVNKREIHEYGGRAHDPDTMVTPRTPKPTLKAEALARMPPTIASCKWKTVVYYESRKRELKIRLMNEGRCDERLETRVEESTCLTYTGCTTKQTTNT